MTDKPGLYQGLSFLEYQQIKAVNSSLLKLFSKSPMHARQYMLSPPDPSDAMELGTACHTAIWEPERFKTDYVTAPKCDKRTAAGKAQWKEFEDANKGRDYLVEDDMARCMAMMAQVWSNESAAAILSAQGKNELVVVWEDSETGILCKARIDKFAKVWGWPIVGDLKTTRDASFESFSKDILKYGYHQQAAFYLDGLQALSPATIHRRWLFICVENVAPYACAVYELDEESIELGQNQYRKNLQRYAECLKSGVWPGYSSEVVRINVPGWALQQGKFNDNYDDGLGAEQSDAA